MSFVVAFRFVSLDQIGLLLFAYLPWHDRGLQSALLRALHPDPEALAEVTLGRGRCQGAVGLEDAVVDEPCGGVELGEEGLDAPAEAVGGVGDGLEDGGADDGLRKNVNFQQAWKVLCMGYLQ